MSKDKQRIIIAEACGATWQTVEWNEKQTQVLSFTRLGPKPSLGPHRWDLNDGRSLAFDIPDYPNDLNAMREAEEFLKQNDWSKFCEMNEILACKVLKPNEHIFHATAEQRAEAFIRTIEKREES